jgi:hypothetical protein
MTVPSEFAPSRAVVEAQEEQSLLDKIIERGTITREASPHEVAAIMGQLDTDKMLRAIADEVNESWFYDFKVDGKTQVVGFGVVGAQEMARIRAEMGFPIRYLDIIEEEVTRHGEIGMRVMMKARCMRSGLEDIGIAFYPWYNEVAIRDSQGNKTKEKKRVLDDKADRKALSVAERNATLGVVPESLQQAILKIRKQLIEKNAARAEKDRKKYLEAQHIPARSVDAQKETARQQTQDPYGDGAVKPVGTPAKLGDESETEPLRQEQRDKLEDMKKHAAITREQRAWIEKGLSNGLTQRQAARAIAQFEQQILEHDRVPAAEAKSA